MRADADLFLSDLENEAIEFIKMNEPPEGYYLAFSGGKDSVVLYDLTKRAGVKFDAHYHITSVDPPELVRFIREEYPGIIFDRPQFTMWELIVKKLMPPTRMVRYCCEFLKEQGGEDRLVLLGNKKTDSFKRKNQRRIEPCQKTGKIRLNPLYYWNDSNVWEYVHKNKIPHCSLYDEGFKRLGCIGCPLAGGKKQLEEFARWPKFKDAYIRAFERMLIERNKKGKETKWRTGQEVFDWWIR